jgi:hypothetical protein
MPIISIPKLNKLNLFQQFLCNILENEKNYPAVDSFVIFLFL